MLEIDVRSSSDSNIQVVTLAGEFAFVDQDRVESLISQAPTDSLRGMVFDLTDVTYMEEAGFETLMLYLQRLSAAGACMAVVVTPGSMLKEKLGRLGFFTIGLKPFSSAEEAEKAMHDGICK